MLVVSIVLLLIVLFFLRFRLELTQRMRCFFLQYVLSFEAVSEKTDQPVGYLLRLEKLASIGIMAGGLTHQINNRLHVIGLLADDLQDLLSTRSELCIQPGMKAFFEQLSAGLSRLALHVAHGKDTVHGLMRYVREEGPSPELCSVSEVLSAAIELAGYKHAAGKIRIVREWPCGETIRINGFFTQLQEVFFNIIDNAFAALLQKEKSRLSTGYIPQLRVRGELLGDNLELSFCDNGAGISPEHQSALFTPFFTTKQDDGKGTGLGLCVIRKIIEENHNGSVEIQSVFGEGTKVVLLLPATGTGSA